MTTTANVLADTIQADGRRSIHVGYSSDYGNATTRTYLVPADFNITAALPEYISDIEDGWRSAEIKSMADIVAAGVLSVPEIISGFKWMTVADALREAVRWGVEGDDPRELANMESVFSYIEENFTDDQVVTLAGIAKAELDIYRQRVSSILSTAPVKATLQQVDALKGKLSG